jgi:hypothetical protein
MLNSLNAALGLETNTVAGVATGTAPVRLQLDA